LIVSDPNPIVSAHFEGDGDSCGDRDQLIFRNHFGYCFLDHLLSSDGDGHSLLVHDSLCDRHLRPDGMFVRYGNGLHFKRGLLIKLGNFLANSNFFEVIRKLSCLDRILDSSELLGLNSICNSFGICSCFRDHFGLCGFLDLHGSESVCKLLGFCSCFRDPFGLSGLLDLLDFESICNLHSFGSRFLDFLGLSSICNFLESICNFFGFCS